MSKKKKGRGGARPGSGPKPKMLGGRRCTFHLGEEHIAALAAFAEALAISKSEALRWAIDLLPKHDDQEPA